MASTFFAANMRPARYNTSMDTQQTNLTETTSTDTEPAIDLEDRNSAIKAIVPGTMSGAEMIAYWEREGVFETFASLNDLIGPGKQYADSTEYMLAMRAEAAHRTLEMYREHPSA